LLGDFVQLRNAHIDFIETNGLLLRAIGHIAHQIRDVGGTGDDIAKRISGTADQSPPLPTRERCFLK